MSEFSERYISFCREMESEYPQMFSRPYGGFAIGEGWFPIIQSLCANINSHVTWSRQQRARDHLRNRAYKKGREAVLAYLTRGKNPSMWDEERADQIMEDGLIEPRAKTRRVYVAQIKEKFGGLRFYYDGGDDVVSGMVRMAESWADKTCESCGNVGKQRHGGWVRTLCDVHEAERQEAMKGRNNE